MDLAAEYGEYFIESRTAFFRSRVRVRDSASVVTADSLVFYRDSRRSVATGTSAWRARQIGSSSSGAGSSTIRIAA